MYKYIGAFPIGHFKMKHSSVVCLDTYMREAWYGQTFGVSAGLKVSASLKQSLPRRVNFLIAQGKVKDNARVHSKLSIT